MRTITTKRKANVTRKAAIDELLKRHPEADLLSMVKRGGLYVATLRVAGEDEGGESDSGGGEDSPAPKKKSPPSDDGPDLGGDDDGGDDDGGDGPDFGGDDLDGPGGMPMPKQDPMMEVVHILKELLQAVIGGGHMGGGHAGPPPPPPGGGMEGPPGGPGGHPGAPPLPPPAKPHPAGGMGGSAFASKRSFVAVRADAHEVSDQDAVREALSHFPGYKVAKLNRDREQNLLKLAMVKQ